MATNGIQMALRYKDLEELQKSTSQKMVPSGADNLYAHARGNGTINWVVRVAVNKKRSNITIGKWPEVKAEAAKQVTPAIKSMLQSGYSLAAVKNALKLSIDPVRFVSLVRGEKVTSAGATPTFENVATDWYERQLKDGLSEGPYKAQVIQQLRDHVFPQIGRRPINEIKQKEIRDALRPLWLERKPTALKVRGNVERIFEWAMGEGLVEDNPTPSARMMPAIRHKVEHMPSLPYERAPEFWQWLMSRPRISVQSKTGIAMALLLAKRTQEIRFIQWNHIDFKNAIWTTPAEGMKMRKPHRQPITEPILSMLQDLKNITGNQKYVLGIGDKPISENTMLFAIKRFDNITLHGFRATCGTWCAENDIDKEVIKFIKAHEPKYLESAYQRTDLIKKRRDALQRWADYVTG